MGADIARRLPEAYEPATRRKALNRTFKRVLADRVEHHVDAAARGKFENSLGEILAARHRNVIAAGPFRLFGLGVARRRADDSRAERLRPSGDNSADAAGGSVDQDRLARPHMGDVMEQKPGAHSLEQQRRGDLVTDRFWEADKE